MQSDIRALSLEQLQTGSIISRSSDSTTTNSNTQTNSSDSTINHATNPGELDSQDDELLTYIDEQNRSTDNLNITNNSSNNAKGSNKESKTKGVLEAYAELWELLDNDVTSDFLAKFKHLFKQFVRPENAYIYEEDLYE